MLFFKLVKNICGYVFINCSSLLVNVELKAEIEKLKLAQKNVQNIDPEKHRLYVQEITSLRMKLHQQEREMAEMQK